MTRPRPVEGFDPRAPLGEVLRDVLRVRFGEALDRWGPAAESEGDEALHDLRVSLRRVRTVLRTFRAEAAGRRWRAAERALRRAFRATGATRDAEVLEQRLARHAARAPERAGPGLEAAVARAARLRRRARPELEEALSPRARAQIVQRMNELLDGRLVRPAAGAAPFGGWAPRRLGEVLDRADRLAEHVSAGARKRDLHALRIALKRVRYLAEVFEPAGPGALAEAIARLGALQDALGDVHDLDVQTGEVVRALRGAETRWLRGLSRRARASEEPARFLAAALEARAPAERWGLFWLLDRLASERAAARDLALEAVAPSLASARAALNAALEPFGGLPLARSPRRGPRPAVQRPRAKPARALSARAASKRGPSTPA